MTDAMKKCLGLTAVVALLMAGCASEPKSRAVRTFDDKLSCKRLKLEVGRSRESQKQVQENIGEKGVNMAHVLYWMPDAKYAYFEPADALPLVNERRAFIEKTFLEKDCPAELKAEEDERKRLKEEKEKQREKNEQGETGKEGGESISSEKILE